MLVKLSFDQLKLLVLLILEENLSFMLVMDKLCHNWEVVAYISEYVTALSESNHFNIDFEISFTK